MPSAEMDETIRVIRRVCRLPLFQLPGFPRPCLRESLALFRVLTRLGYPARFHIGVRKVGEQLWGHSWITCHGRPLCRADQDCLFWTLYSYPESHTHSIRRGGAYFPTSRSRRQS
jgi:hypothetical protein